MEEEFSRCFLPEGFGFLELPDGGVEGAKEGFGFGVELVALRVGEVGWGRLVFGVVAAFVVVLLLVKARRGVDAEVGVPD